MRSPNPIFSARASEQLVCGWALQNDRWLDDLAVALLPEHFEDARMGALYGAIIATRAKGMRATPDTLEQWAENSEIWRPAELFALSGRGRCGAYDEFESAARTIISNANGRLLLARIDDARFHVMENTSEDPAVLFSKVEALFRSTALSGSVRVLNAGEASSAYLGRLEAGEARGIRTGLTDVDGRHGSFIPGELIIIAGETASGKTTLATNLARRFSEQGLRGHFASYEMTEPQVYPRMWSAISYDTPEIEAFEYKALRRNDRGGVRSETLRACDVILNERFSSLVIDVCAAQTLAELEASIRATKRRLGGLDFAIVDYLQRMRPSISKAERHLQVQEITEGLKTLALRHQIPVFALSTINRENQKRGDKRPQRSDMRESGSIEYDADIILAVYRPARELEVELRAIANDPDVSEEVYFQKAADLDRLKDKLELLSLKARQGEEGTDYLRINLGYDIIRDGVAPRATYRGRYE